MGSFHRNSKSCPSGKSPELVGKRRAWVPLGTVAQNPLPNRIGNGESVVRVDYRSTSSNVVIR